MDTARMDGLICHFSRNRKEHEEVAVIGDSLASYFSPDVIKTANQIYRTPLPPNERNLCNL